MHIRKAKPPLVQQTYQRRHSLAAETMFEPVGVWAHRRRQYLKQHHKILYYNLLTSGKLHSHLADVEEEAQSLFLRLVKEYAEREGMTEQLKAENPIEWVGRMNCIRSRVTETVNAELILT